jgi:hypothetical protein
MRGKVEVYAIASDGSQRLLLCEPNLIVNGAGESIVDMLTTPSCVLGVTPHIMDTSNWRWGAISFGPAASSFQENAYFFPKDGIYSKTDNLCHGVSANVSSLIHQIGTDHRLRVLWASSLTGEVSSYTPPYRLPSYPDPLNKKLEDASTSYSLVSSLATSGSESEGTSYGHFENRIQFAPNDSSSYFQGAFPHGGLAPEYTPSAFLVSSYEGDFQADPFLNYISSGLALPEGKFNTYGLMDYRGFISLGYDPYFYEVTAARPLVGMASVSAAASPSNVSAIVLDPRVTATVNIYKDDVWVMNLYGGLHQIGLWNMNCKKALESNAPPFLEGDPSYPLTPNFLNTTTGITKQEFRLFAKKTFTENLCAIKDVGVNAGMVNPQSLKIVWTIDFRSQHD